MIDGLTFGDPWFLALLVPLAAFGAWWLSRRRERGADGAPGDLLEGLPRTWRTALMPLPAACLALAAVGLVVALARPLAGREESKVTSEGIDVLLVVDTSSSMLADSLQRGVPSIDVVKGVVAEFVRARPDDRLGLVSFAVWPKTECPLTLDKDALLARLSEVHCVRPNSEEDGTGIGVAIGQAARKLENSDAKSRVVVLLTDGQNNQHDVEPAEAAALCKDLGIRVYTILAGAEPTLASGGFVFPRPDGAAAAALLQMIAQTTGGRFFRARDTTALSDVYAEIDKLERTKREDVRYTAFDDLYPWVVWPAVACLALALLLGRGPLLEFAT